MLEPVDKLAELNRLQQFTLLLAHYATAVSRYTSVLRKASNDPIMATKHAKTTLKATDIFPSKFKAEVVTTKPRDFY